MWSAHGRLLLLETASVKEISPAAQKVIEETVENYPKKWTHGICAYTGVHRETGKDFIGRGKTGDICHAGLNYVNTKDGICINAHKKEWFDGNPEYIRWMAGESPFSHGFLNGKDIKEFSEHGMVIDMAEVGQGGALWSCKAMRYFVEDTWKPETWLKLREAGLTGLQAFIGASILNAAGDPMSYSHVNLVSYQSPEKLRKVYDEFSTIKRLDTSTVNRLDGNYGDPIDVKNWGSLAGKSVRKPDGWGGFTEVRRPCPPKEYVSLLKEIFEGDPKNVSKD
jgi:hypothetical protein